MPSENFPNVYSANEQGVWGKNSNNRKYLSSLKKKLMMKIMIFHVRSIVFILFYPLQLWSGFLFSIKYRLLLRRNKKKYAYLFTLKNSHSFYCGADNKVYSKIWYFLLNPFVLLLPWLQLKTYKKAAAIHFYTKIITSAGQYRKYINTRDNSTCDTNDKSSHVYSKLGVTFIFIYRSVFTECPKKSNHSIADLSTHAGLWGYQVCPHNNTMLYPQPYFQIYRHTSA